MNRSTVGLMSGYLKREAGTSRRGAILFWLVSAWLLLSLPACTLLPARQTGQVPVTAPAATSTLPPSPTPVPPPSPTPSPSPVPATDTPVPQAGPDQLNSPAPLTTEEILALAVIPVRDQRLLAERLKLHGQTIPSVVVDTPPARQVGDVETFWVGDLANSLPRHFQTTARLAIITDHAYWWVEEGVEIDMEALQRSAGVFEEHTYPTNRGFFGSEWSPGVDNDPHLYIFLGVVPGVGGYYSSSDEYSNLVNEFSNEHEMFFINVRNIPPGSEFFDGVLAHEFQHMIHWHQDRNEPVWVNEGLSELAVLINGFGDDRQAQVFLSDPDLQLNTWVGLADARRAALAHYGASYLFMTYFLEQFGEGLMQSVVADPANGEAGFEEALAKAGLAVTFDEVFANWLVANYLDDPAQGDGRFGYHALDLEPVQLDRQISGYPTEWEATVSQYGADYVELTGRGDVTVEFGGNTTTRIIDNQAHSGRYQWYSNRGDAVDATLTRAFDLRGVETATLDYWVWYVIEEGWDYAYVEVSTDGGQTFTPLATPRTRSDNPSGNAYGPGYTGRSAETPDWVRDSVDLSPYAGQEILVRFEYVTDDAVNDPGFAVDDISIPEIGYFYDAETGDDGWLAEGFVRVDNTLRQRFTVQVIEQGAETVVRQMALDENNQGRYTVRGLGDQVQRAVIVVSAQAMVTTEAASYRIRVEEAPAPAGGG